MSKGNESMETKQKHFINTTDENVAKRLREYGFPELPKNGNKWVFVNELPDDKNIHTFANEDLKDTVFTNNLVI